MYHSWGSHNGWLRQITAENCLYMDRARAQKLGIADGDWVWIASAHRPREGPRQADGGRQSRHGVDLERDRPARRRRRARHRCAGGDARLPAQPPDRASCCRSARAATASPTAIRSPARPHGTTCASRIEKAAPDEVWRNLSAVRCRCIRRRGQRRGRRHDQPAGTHRQEARPGDRSRHLRRLPGLRDELQGMERRRLFRAADRPGRARQRSARRLAQPRALLRGRRRRARAAPCISRAPACIARTPACVTVCPTGASYKRASDGIVLVNPDTCIGCKLCSWACPYGAREYDYDDGVMKKCTLCVDRIYNETFAPEDRVPACVRACPTGARHFGDLGDPDSAVSQLVQGARRLRSAAGDRLQAGQQVSAAAAAPRPEYRAGAAGHRATRGPLRFARRPLLRLGRQDPGALNSTMHPAYSVIVFTTASGAGYGLLIWLARRRLHRISCRAIPCWDFSASAWRSR